MNIIDIGPIFSFLLFLILVSAVSKALVFIAQPLTYGGRGVVNYGRNFENYLSLTISFFRMPRLPVLELIKVLLVLSLLTSAVLMIPIFSAPLFLGPHSLLVFLLLVLLARLIWTFTLNFQDHRRLMDSKKENFLVSTLSWMIFVSTVLFTFQENLPLSGSDQAGLFKFSLFSYFYFFFLFIASGFFFLSKEKAGGNNYTSIVFSVSRSLWFLLLSWVFLGSISGSTSTNFIFFVLLVSVLMAVHEVVSGFFGGISERMQERFEEIAFLPMLLLCSILVCLEIIL